MTWQLCIILFYVFAAASTISERAYARHSTLPRMVPPALAFTFGVMPVCLIGAFIMGDVWVNWSWETCVLLVVGGTLIGLSFLLGFQALRYLLGSRYEIINQLSTLISIVVGGFLLGETLQGEQYLGAGLVLMGVLIATRSSLAISGTRNVYSHRGLVLALIATTALGLGMVAEKALLDHMSASGYIVYGFGAQALVLLLLSWTKLRRDNQHITAKELKGSISYGLCLGLGGIFYIMALQKADNLAVVAAVSAFQMPISVVACMIILHEKRNIGRIVGSISICLAGLLILLNVI